MVAPDSPSQRGRQGTVVIDASVVLFRGELPPEAGEAAVVAFRTQEISLLHPDGMEERTWELAKQGNLPTCYDAAYLALAELMEAELWTADRRFATALRKKARRVRLIGR